MSNRLMITPVTCELSTKNTPVCVIDIMHVCTSNVEYGVPFGAHSVMVPSTDAENITLPSFL